MTWPDEIVFKRPVGTPAVDSESGQRTGIEDRKVIYSGGSRIQNDHRAIERMISGDEKVSDYSLVFLPSGTHGILENDIAIAGGVEGRVRPVSRFTQKHYTRLLVNWDAS